MRGFIKNVNLERGFGFVSPEGGGADLFFHVSALKDLPFDESLQQREVLFHVVDGKRGPRCENIRAAR